MRLDRKSLRKILLKEVEEVIRDESGEDLDLLVAEISPDEPLGAFAATGVSSELIRSIESIVDAATPGKLRDFKQSLGRSFPADVNGQLSAEQLLVGLRSWLGLVTVM